MNASTATAPTQITPAQVAQFQNDGFLVVKGLYGAPQMAEWKRLMHEVLDLEAKGRGAGGWSMVESGVRVWNGQQIHPTLLEAMRDDHVTPVLKKVIGPDVEFLSAKAVFKNSTTNFPSPWHQDWFYWEGAHKTSVWIALDDATVANGCLKFVVGSHKKIFDKKTVQGNAFVNQVDVKDLEGLPVVNLEVKRGDAVFFHDLAVHSSHPNTAKADRWSLISTYRNSAVKDECGLNADLWAKPMVISGKSVNGGLPA